MFPTYSVVHFYDDESVEAIPSDWIKDDLCAWPTNQNCVSKYIQNKHKPNDFDFTYLKARVLVKGISMTHNYITMYNSNSAFSKCHVMGICYLVFYQL